MVKGEEEDGRAYVQPRRLACHEPQDRDNNAELPNLLESGARLFWIEKNRFLSSKIFQRKCVRVSVRHLDLRNLFFSISNAYTERRTDSYQKPSLPRCFFVKGPISQFI